MLSPKCATTGSQLVQTNGNDDTYAAETRVHPTTSSSIYASRAMQTTLERWLSNGPVEARGKGINERPSSYLTLRMLLSSADQTSGRTMALPTACNGMHLSSLQMQHKLEGAPHAAAPHTAAPRCCHPIRARCFAVLSTHRKYMPQTQPPLAGDYTHADAAATPLLTRHNAWLSSWHMGPQHSPTKQPTL